MKFIIALLVALLLNVLQVDLVYSRRDVHVHERIVVVPNTKTTDPVTGSLCHQYYSSDMQSSCSTMNFTQFLVFSSKNSVKDVIFISGVYVVDSGKKKHQIKFQNTVTGHNFMNFTGAGDVVIKCITECSFNFLNITSLYMNNIFFENCSSTTSEGKNNTKGTLYVEAQECNPSNVSLINIRITNSMGNGIIVNLKKLNREDTNTIHSFTLVNSSINTSSSCVYVGKRNDYVNQHFIVSNVSFFSNESCFELMGQNKTHTILNVSLSGSHCKSSILSMSSKGKHTSMMVSITNLIIKDSESNVVVHFDKPDAMVNGQFKLHNNTGVALLLSSSKFHFCDTNVDISFNHANVREGSNSIIMLADKSHIVFKNSDIFFGNNSGLMCGGITAKSESKLIFTEKVRVNFTGNRGEQGGAISLYSESSLLFENLTSDSYLNFSYNKAFKGGAIFIEDSSCHQHQTCTILPAIKVQGILCNGCLYFENNSAVLGGNNIYGGWVDWSIKYENEIVYNPSFSELIKEDSSGIASDPLRICLCMNGIPDCNITEWNEPRDLYPGQILTGIEAMAVGQRYGTVVSPVVIRKESDEGRYEIRIVQRKCTNLTYNVSSQNNNETLLIEVLKSNEFGLNPQNKNTRLQFGNHVVKKYPETLGNLFTQLSIKLKLKDCPKAFTLDMTSSICACPQNLDLLGLKCDNSNYAIIRSAEQWVGMAYNQVIAHQFCPYDYCKITQGSLSLRLEDDSEVCAEDRRGILCGMCKTNFSKVTGTSKCKQCPNLNILAAIPTFLVAGLLLVTLLLLLNLTVSSGTISGLIFYANVLQAQNATFSLPHASFLSVFIAWLNLDQGLETCLYNGLDSYVESWLQFLFPAYIWLIAGVVIVSSHYSTRISNLCGKNAVPVLATLFLLTYTKLLRLEITVVSYTSITYPNGHPNKTVWLYDGNVDYLKGKHIPLFIATVLLLDLLSVPYTLSLVSIQWLFKISHYRPMFWVNKLKPFFDAYTGPYRARHRYWTGLLLLIRILLLISFSLNHSNNPSINILIIGVTSTLLLLWLFFIGGVFESKLNNCLEAFFLCNLIVTSFCTLFELYNKNASPAVIKVSTGLAFVVFVGIILYHTHKQLLLTKAGTKMKKLFKVVHFKWDSRVETDDNNLQSTSKDTSLNKVSCTVVELAEPLLEDETRD